MRYSTATPVIQNIVSLRSFLSHNAFLLADMLVYQRPNGR